MKWTKARFEHICGNYKCHKTIEVGDSYLSSPYKCFCVLCGAKYENGDLQFSQKHKGYIDETTITKCSFCDENGTNRIHGTATCDEHIGQVISNEG